jgi:hypothetical protein
MERTGDGSIPYHGDDYLTGYKVFRAALLLARTAHTAGGGGFVARFPANSVQKWRIQLFIQDDSAKNTASRPFSISS